MKRKTPKHFRNKGRGIPPIQYTHDLANFQNTPSSSGYFRSNINQNVTIDYGDGTVTTYALTANVNFSFVTADHTYASPWQAGVDKLVTITFDHPDNVTALSFYYSGSKINAPTNLSYYKNLVLLQFAGAVGGSTNSARRVNFFPFEVLELAYIQTLTFSAFFNIAGSDFDDEIPIVLFNKPLVSLEYRENLSTNYVANNMALIYTLSATLQSLTIGNSANPAAFNDLPDDAVYGFQHLVNLTTLDCRNANSFTTYPTVLNQIPSLVNINMSASGFGSGGWGDLSNLVNLVNLTQQSSPGLPATVPFWLINTIRIKSMRMSGTWNTIARIDTWLDNLYMFLDTNASKTVSPPLNSWRSMSNNFSGILATGVYQQPSGYVAGVSNGTPATPQEKMWLMVNQYAHAITRTAYTVSGVTVGATTNITFSAAPGSNFRVGSVITFLGVTGTVGALLNGLNHTITVIAGSVITISTNTTGSAYTSGGNIYRITY